tara:strand:+ start:390 stop:551 length:162 start_codon:yes stop_codon:yes gene_type:complete
MKKNFIYIKTGHEASDAYFANLAVWNDIDILKSFGFGAVVVSVPFIFYLVFFN